MNEIPDRLWHLLADKATVGLEPPEEAELRALLDRHPEIDSGSFDHLAALLEETCPLPREPLPTDLIDRIEAEATLRDSSPSILRPTRETSWFALSGWLLAAGLLAVLIAGWLTAPRPHSHHAARARLMTASATLTFPIKHTDAPNPISGDLVWNPETHEGYLRVVSLPTHDPTETTYQIWIFDSTRNQLHPVDGGVFDVASAGEVVVPVRTGLKIRKPTHFVVTREAAGGVVVSDRKQVMFVAAP